MEVCIKICFRYQEHYYSCFVTIMHQFETDFIHIELLDSSLVEAITITDISYIGEKGYKQLPAYNITSIRPVLIHLGDIIECILNVANNESLNKIQNEGHFLRN